MNSGAIQQNNRYLAYVRVSSKDQARGTSLDEQKARIERYAAENNLHVVNYYGEVESASIAGREIFANMINQLRTEKLAGIIFHKADRSARNPKDQATLYDLVMQGHTLHFAEEHITTNDPRGRQVMYLMWAVASGYSENLRTEINKGLEGRLKQGKLPGPAPTGYVKGPDCTSIPDPAKAPLVRQLFKEYGTGKYSVEAIKVKAAEIGLTNKGGRKLDKNAVHDMLRQPFYYGLIRHKKGMFEGVHEPLISKALFDKVQFILRDKGFKIEHHFKYVFQGLLPCFTCQRPMKAMTAKGRLKYYLCRHCKGGGIREDALEQQWLTCLQDIQFTKQELAAFNEAVEKYFKTETQDTKTQAQALQLESKNITVRLQGLLQKYIDQKIDDETYRLTRQSLLNRQIEIKEIIAGLDAQIEKNKERVKEIGKLLECPVLLYKQADPVNKRRLIISMVANLEVKQKLLIPKWKKQFEVVANRPNLGFGGDGGS